MVFSRDGRYVLIKRQVTGKGTLVYLKKMDQVLSEGYDFRKGDRVIYRSKYHSDDYGDLANLYRYLDSVEYRSILIKYDLVNNVIRDSTSPSKEYTIGVRYMDDNRVRIYVYLNALAQRLPLHHVRNQVRTVNESRRRIYYTFKEVFWDPSEKYFVVRMVETVRGGASIRYRDKLLFFPLPTIFTIVNKALYSHFFLDHHKRTRDMLDQITRLEGNYFARSLAAVFYRQRGKDEKARVYATESRRIIDKKRKVGRAGPLWRLCRYWNRSVLSGAAKDADLAVVRRLKLPADHKMSFVLECERYRLMPDRYSKKKLAEYLLKNRALDVDLRLYAASVLLAAARKPAAALRVLRQRLALYTLRPPADPVVLLRDRHQIAIYHSLMGDRRQALQALDRLRELFQKEGGRSPAAQTVLRSARLLRAELLYREKRYSELLDELPSRIVEGGNYEPSRRHLYAMIADAYYRTGKLPQARSVYSWILSAAGKEPARPKEWRRLCRTIYSRFPDLKVNGR